MLLLGVDLGTTATKAALYDASARLVSEGRAEVPLHHPQPGSVEQEMSEFYQSAASAIRQCMNSCRVDPSQVAGVAFDSQMAGIGAIDEDFKPATRFDSWLDSRCQPYIEEMNRHFADRVTALTGCPPTCNHGPKMLWWANERPSDYARIAKFVTPSSYLAGRAVKLRADEAFIDHTFLHFTSVSDAAAGTWSRELCATLGIDAGRLPKIVEPWTVVGELSSEAASDFGLKSGTPVAAGCGDTAAGALGAGIVRPGMLLDTAGTASVLACCTDRFVADTTHRTLMVMRSVVPGIWNPLAYVGGGGLALGWYGREFSEHRGTQPRVRMNRMRSYSRVPWRRLLHATACCFLHTLAGAYARRRRPCEELGSDSPGGTGGNTLLGPFLRVSATSMRGISVSWGGLRRNWT